MIRAGRQKSVTVPDKDFSNALSKLLPKKMIPIVVKLSSVSPDKKVNQISVANVLQRLLTSGEYDETIYDQVCEYF